VIGSHHGESLCSFLVEIKIILWTTNKQWNLYITPPPAARDMPPMLVMPLLPLGVICLEHGHSLSREDQGRSLSHEDHLARFKCFQQNLSVNFTQIMSGIAPL
jgi:hypothetical protein